MIRYRDGLLFAAMVLSGCQSTSGLFQNRFASIEEYSPEETMAMNQPLPEAQSGSFANAITPNAGPTSNNNTPVALASYNQANTPQQAGGNSVASLVEAGQNAIRNAGQNNPAGLQNAKQLFQQALAMDSTNGKAHHGIAIVSDLQEDWASAEQHYKQALAVDPANPSLLNDLGYSYLLQNRYNESQQYLNQAIQLDARHERAHLNLALLSLRRGDTAGAQNTLSKVFSPQDVPTNLARLQQDLQKLMAKSNGGMIANAGYPMNGPTAMPHQPQVGANAVYPVSQTQPSDWNANRPQNMNPAGGFGQQMGMNPGAPAMGNPSYSAGPNGMMGSQRQFSGGNGNIVIDPALRAPSGKPISIYPPGVLKKEVAAQLNQQNQQTAGIPSQGNTVNQFPLVGQNNAAGTMPGGLQIPGGQPASVNQFPLANPGAMPANTAANPYGAPSNSASNAAAMGLNVGPGMPFPVGGVPVATPQPLGQPAAGSFGNQTMAQPLLQPGAGPMPSMNTVPGQANYGQANYGQLPAGTGAVPSTTANYGNGLAIGQPLPSAANPGFGQPANAGTPVNSVSYGQPAGATATANYGQPGTMPNAVNPGAAQALGPAALPMGGMQHQTPGVTPGPMQQFEQQQMNRINDQYNQALQQMNGRGFPGQ